MQIIIIIIIIFVRCILMIIFLKVEAPEFKSLNHFLFSVGRFR